MNTKYIRRAQYKQGLGPIAVVLIVAVLLGGGYAAYKQYAKEYDYDGAHYKNGEPVGPASDVSTKDNETLHSNSAKSTSDTKDWKTYRNDTYGFEFSYRTVDFSLKTVDATTKKASRFDGKWIVELVPTESLIKQYIGKCIESAHENLKKSCNQSGSREETTGIHLEIVDLPFSQLPSQNTGSDTRLDYSLKTEDAIVAEIPVHKYRYSAEGGEGMETIAFAVSDTQSLLVVRSYFYLHAEPIFDTMLSTFRFTK